jgi:Ca2+-binding EF-hand superfamily protein
MMTAITGGGTLTQQLYQRLFDRLNTNSDDALSFDEMSGAGASSKSAEAFKTLDANDDGKVVRAEMTPSSTFSADTLNAMLLAQTDQPPQTNEEIVSDLFTRADADGDGALSADERSAEAAIRRASSLDAGYAPDHAYMMSDRDGDGLIRQNEVLVARRVHIPASAITFSDEVPADLVRRMEAVRLASADPASSGGQVSPPVEPLTAEEKQKVRDQFTADWAERDSGPAGTTRYLGREIDGLRDKAEADFAKAPVTDSLTARLMQRILAGWSAEPAGAPSSSTLA